MPVRPLTIVHVGSFPFGLRPGFQHGVPTKLSQGLIRIGHQVLNFPDRDVARAKSWFGSRKFGRGAVNTALRSFCRFHKPDVLVLSHADMIGAETVAAIREDLPGLRVGQCNVDPLFEPDNVRRLQSKLGVVDATLVSTAGAPLAALAAESRSLGTGAFAFLPNPVDLSIERGSNHLRADLPYDLFYACGHPSQPLRTVCGRAWDMDDFVRDLGKRLPGVRLLLGGVLGHPHFSGGGYQTALESVALGLNISRRPDHFLYSSDRLAHLIGNGVAVVMERATGYDSLFSDDEMVFFSSLDELAEKVARLSADTVERQRLAAAGRTRYYGLFNEQLVAAYVLDVILGTCDPSRYSFPTLAGSGAGAAP